MAVTSLARDGVATYAHYNKMSAGFSGTSRIVVWGDSNTRITSTDLVNWTATTGTISNPTPRFYPITKNGRMICLGGVQQRDWDYSYDGVTFYNSFGVVGDANAFYQAFELTAANNIAYTSFYSSTKNHLAREYATFSGPIATAPWTAALNGVADNGVNGPSAIWVVTGGTGTSYSTNDGITWTSVSPVISGARVYWGIDKFLMFSSSSTTYYTSTNGSTWTTRTFPVANVAVSSVRFTGGQWFLGGASGALYTSPDGITWTSRTSGAGANAVNGFGYAAGVYVACGAGGYVATSPDGVTWTARSTGTTNALFVVGGI
jgi:hypothetical protein